MHLHFYCRQEDPVHRQFYYSHKRPFAFTAMTRDPVHRLFYWRHKGPSAQALLLSSQAVLLRHEGPSAQALLLPS